MIQTTPLESLEGALSRFDSLLVAYSGGVDSAVLLAAARRVLGDRVIALTADSPSIPREELRRAKELAATIGARHVVVETNEIERAEYARNDRDRCYFCKETLFATCERVANDTGISHVAYGYTKDDARDFRPGHRAATKFHVHAPLFDAGLGKNEIRVIAREMKLDVWDKPAAPCLSSRIPYGSQVTIDKLRQIEEMEALLHELGFRVCRARFDGTAMRIELEPADIARAASPAVRAQLVDRGRALGISLVTLDLDGFRSGKLNEAP